MLSLLNKCVESLGYVHKDAHEALNAEHNKLLQRCYFLQNDLDDLSKANASLADENEALKVTLKNALDQLMSDDIKDVLDALYEQIGQVQNKVSSAGACLRNIKDLVNRLKSIRLGTPLRADDG